MALACGNEWCSQESCIIGIAISLLFIYLFYLVYRTAEKSNSIWRRRSLTNLFKVLTDRNSSRQQFVGALLSIISVIKYAGNTAIFGFLVTIFSLSAFSACNGGSSYLVRVVVGIVDALSKHGNPAEITPSFTPPDIRPQPAPN